jgi:hypothetical protein
MKYSRDGKNIGELENGILRKQVKESVHLLKKLDAWGIDLEVFEKVVEQNGEIRIFDTENELLYTVKAKVGWEQGRQDDYGYGEQVFIPRSLFSVISYRRKMLTIPSDHETHREQSALNYKP